MTIAAPDASRYIAPTSHQHSHVTHAPPPRGRPVVVVTRRMLIMAGLAVALAVIHIPYRPRTFCLFREVTGIPCPFCGGTTAVSNLGHGDIKGALAASPLGVAMVCSWPFLDVVKPPAWLQPKSVRWPVILAILVASEIFELFRFHIL